ncbi:LMBR1-like region-containing protein [Planoprotostelium fungivorum]|uniref:LMBR1-like region-containing protein n=1 Tax=Planoprotostelium fungivorum TaxID=1890364 RepID=A0A2P6NQ14_9EUKA|nr:LMBR1-like region-containing protein [Planoprotostelium fungivorum]
MVNVILIVIAVVMSLVILASCIYVLVYFSDEADKNTAYFPKGLVVLGLFLSFVMILLLPLDVANARTNGGLAMNGLWIAAFIAAVVLIVIVLPFAIFFYEAEDPGQDSFGKKFAEGLKYSLVVFFLYVLFTTVLWVFIGEAEVPYTHLRALYVKTTIESTSICTPQPACLYIPFYAVITQPSSTTATLNFIVSPILYGISILTLMGVILFVVFGGVGLAALPLDLFHSWKNRPRFIPAEVYYEQRNIVGNESTRLLEVGEKLMDMFKRKGSTRPTTRRHRKAYNRFKTEVYFLQDDYDKMEKMYNKGLGPKILIIVWSWIQLVLSFLSAGVSIAWVIHIIVYDAPQFTGPPLNLFLNQMFVKLDDAWGLLGVTAYGIFAFYLLLCTIKGNFKFGLRIPLFFSIHPMKVNGTMMNAFLFNTMLLLTSTICVLQFCSLSFSLYSRYTTIDVIMNVGVQNLKYIKYFWRYYYLAILLFFFVTLIYLLAFPSDKRRSKRRYLVGAHSTRSYPIQAYVFSAENKNNFFYSANIWSARSDHQHLSSQQRQMISNGIISSHDITKVVLDFCNFAILRLTCKLWKDIVDSFTGCLTNFDLLLAVERDNIESLRFLSTRNELDPSSEDNELLINVVQRDSTEMQETTKPSEVQPEGHSDILQLLLSDSRVDPSARENQAIECAVYEGCNEILQLLLSDPRLLLSASRVNPSLADNNTIRKAAEVGLSDIVQLLLNNPRATRYAAFGGHTEIVQLLLSDSRVDPSARDNEAIGGFVSTICEGGFVQIVRVASSKLCGCYWPTSESISPAIRLCSYQQQEATLASSSYCCPILAWMYRHSLMRPREQRPKEDIQRWCSCSTITS